ncbi:MAG TPA: OPT/YSL family transporter, partial [Acidobacteriota bacterium]|nr:OPT/YSL family transporter [Acidobacteriota bacterium]
MPDRTPDADSYREITVSAMVFAVIIGAVMNAAITYAGLKIGFTIGGSAIAAVLGFGVLRGILRRGSILETNIAQTVASAINTSNSGVIFTVPVLFLLGYQISLGDRDFWVITAACVAGALLGTVFIIPLRKQMLDIERLRFPSPTGVATILKSPGAGPAKALVLLGGCMIGALLYLPAGLPTIQTTADIGDLDALVERDRLTPARRDHTRMIAGWIEAGEAPAEVIASGQRAERVRVLRERIEEAREQEAARAAELQPELRRETELLEAEFAGVSWNEELAHRAYLAAKGEIPWSDLRHRATGWATAPLFGYMDVPWRYAADVDGEKTAWARSIDTGAVPVLTQRVDRDGDGRPD